MSFSLSAPLVRDALIKEFNKMDKGCELEKEGLAPHGGCWWEDCKICNPPWKKETNVLVFENDHFEVHYVTVGTPAIVVTEKSQCAAGLSVRLRTSGEGLVIVSRDGTLIEPHKSGSVIVKRW